MSATDPLTSIEMKLIQSFVKINLPEGCEHAVVSTLPSDYPRSATIFIRFNAQVNTLISFFLDTSGALYNHGVKIGELSDPRFNEHFKKWLTEVIASKFEGTEHE